MSMCYNKCFDSIFDGHVPEELTIELPSNHEACKPSLQLKYVRYNAKISTQRLNSTYNVLHDTP